MEVGLRPAFEHHGRADLNRRDKPGDSVGGLNWQVCGRASGDQRRWVRWRTQSWTPTIFLEALERALGEVAEWSIAAVLKTAGPQGPGGSNPSLSAIFLSARGKRKWSVKIGIPGSVTKNLRDYSSVRM